MKVVLPSSAQFSAAAPVRFLPDERPCDKKRPATLQKVVTGSRYGSRVQVGRERVYSSAPKSMTLIEADSSDSIVVSTSDFQPICVGATAGELQDDDALLDNTIFVLPGLATLSECADLIVAADQWATSRSALSAPEDEPSSHVQRASIAFLDSQCQSIASTLIARCCLNLQRKLPAVASECFGERIARSRDLAARACAGFDPDCFAPNEPAVNIYGVGGCFPAHEDRQALTLLVPLSAGSVAFEGGGTGFWASDAIRLSDDPAEVEPTIVVRPVVPGTALLFGGNMKHAALPVLSGKRHCFVSSFTPVGVA